MLTEENDFIDEDVGSMSTNMPTPRMENGINHQADLSFVAGLKEKVSQLVEELSVEKAKVKELQNFNQTLQKCKDA